MRVWGYNVGCGDCFRIEFTGRSGKKRNIFIDAGFERSYRDLFQSVFAEIKGSGDFVDLWIISHIHDDHIGGAVNYIKAITAQQQTDIVNSWWFNTPRHTINRVKAEYGDAAISFRQGDFLSSYLSANPDRHLDWIHNTLEAISLDGLEIEVLSPDLQALENLREKYRDPKIELQKSEDIRYDKAIAARIRDYNLVVDKFDLSKWKEDNNLENASSIAILASLDEKKVMLLGDAHPSVIEKKLVAKGYSITNQLKCDLIKVSHHGSLGNSSSSLYSLLDCSNYLISCDGKNSHGLPQKACLLQILLNPGRKRSTRYSFIFTSNDNYLRDIFKVDGEQIFETLNFELIFPESNYFKAL